MRKPNADAVVAAPDDASDPGGGERVTPGDLPDGRIPRDDPRCEEGMAAPGAMLEDRLRHMRGEGGVDIAPGNLAEYIEGRAAARGR